MNQYNNAALGLVILASIVLAYLIPTGRIFSKAGWGWGWVFLTIIPVIGLFVWWAFAFSRWPIEPGLHSRPADNDTVLCPRCKELIQRDARTCRYCDYDMVAMRARRGKVAETATI